jgi:tetratricopeptide (TPR) repeat protein
LSTRTEANRWLPALLWLLLVAFAFSLGLQKIRTFDYWWHLRTGALIAETGSVPTVDPYSYTVAGNPWIDIHWLHQVGLHALHSLGGHDAVVIGKAVFVVLLALILGTIGWRRERPWVSALAVGLMLASAGDRFMPRPELPSFVCLAAVLALLDRFERRGDVWVYAIVPVQLLWINVHGLFALGLAVVGIHLAAEVVRPLVQPGASLRRARLLRLGGVLALSVLASLLNPNSWEGLLYPIQQLQMVGPPEDRGVFGSIIAELVPPLAAGISTSFPLSLVPVSTLAFLSLCCMALNWRQVRASDPLVWVAFVYLGLGAQRNLAVFAIVAAPILVRNANQFLDRHPIPRRAPGLASLAVAAGLALLTLDVARGTWFPRIGSHREPGLGTLDVYYPIAAAEWIARERPPGPISHHMADGGYLIWRLWPDYPVMTDGRLEVYGPERFVELQVAGPERFRALDQELHFGVVLVHYSLIQSDELLRWLHLNPNWRLVHLDEVAALFVRAGEERVQPYPELDIDADDLFPPLEGPAGPSDRVRRLARTQLYMGLHRFERALALWEETLALYPDLDQGPIVQAALLQKTGASAAAEEILRGLLARDPDDPVLLTQIGDLRFEAGDRDAAQELYARSLELDRDLAYTLFRNGVLAEARGDAELAGQFYGRVFGTAHPADPVSIQARLRLEALLAAGSGLPGDAYGTY